MTEFGSRTPRCDKCKDGGMFLRTVRIEANGMATEVAVYSGMSTSFRATPSTDTTVAIDLACGNCGYGEYKIRLEADPTRPISVGDTNMWLVKRANPGMNNDRNKTPGD